jgi:hypothetical protein
VFDINLKMEIIFVYVGSADRVGILEGFRNIVKPEELDSVYEVISFIKQTFERRQKILKIAASIC